MVAIGFLSVFFYNNTEKLGASGTMIVHHASVPWQATCKGPGSCCNAQLNTLKAQLNALEAGNLGARLEMVGHKSWRECLAKEDQSTFSDSD